MPKQSFPFVKFGKTSVRARLNAN